MDMDSPMSDLMLQARKPVPGSAEEVLFFAGCVSTLPAPINILLEVRVASGGQNARVAFCSERSDLAPFAFEALRAALG